MAARWIPRIAGLIAAGLCCFPFAGVTHAAAVFPAKVLAFYEVRQATTDPVLDGVLEDAAWREAAVADAYYRYWESAAIPAALRTEFRMVYSAKGIFLGIANYDSQPEKIRAAKATRDDPGLWQDDCAEIYFDPSGLTIGYTKFVVNALGTLGDMRRVDASVSQENWSGSGWQAKTARRPDGWVIEAFFPWSDLGGSAQPGDIWRFCHVRYAYSSGSFVGATSAPGGNYQSPQNFGYLFFSPAGGLDTNRIGAVLGRATPPPWAMPLRDGFLVSLQPGTTEFQRAADLVQAERATAASLTASVGKLFQKLRAPAVFAERVRNLLSASTSAEPVVTPAGALKSLRELSAVERDADELCWALKLHELLEAM